jgi:prevent-host-death family protein
MTVIRPVSDLRNKFNEISQLCHQENEPVFITRGGKEDMVVMSHTHYERLQLLLELYGKLAEAESLDAAGDRGITHREMMRRLRQRIS